MKDFLSIAMDINSQSGHEPSKKKHLIMLADQTHKKEIMSVIRGKETTTPGSEAKI